MNAFDVVKQWGSVILGALAFLGVLWNRLHIEHLDVRTDGLEIKYENAAKRAAHAEGELKGHSDERDRAEQKEERDR